MGTGTDVKVNESSWIDPEYRGKIGRVVGTMRRWVMVQFEGEAVGFERHELSII